MIPVIEFIFNCNSSFNKIFLKHNASIDNTFILRFDRLLPRTTVQLRINVQDDPATISNFF